MDLSEHPQMFEDIHQYYTMSMEVHTLRASTHPMSIYVNGVLDENDAVQEGREAGTRLAFDHDMNHARRVLHASHGAHAMHIHFFTMQYH